MLYGLFNRHSELQGVIDEAYKLCTKKTHSFTHFISCDM